MFRSFLKSITSAKYGGIVHEITRMRQKHSGNPLFTAQTTAQSNLSLVGLGKLSYALSPESELVDAICHFWKTREIMLDPMDVIRYSSHDDIPDTAANPRALESAYSSVAYNKTKINDIGKRLPAFTKNDEFFRYFLKELCGYGDLISPSNGYTDDFFQEVIVYVRRRSDLWR